MLRTTLLFFALLASAPAQAVDYRWTSAFAMGTIEAIIHNASGASVNIYCPSGQEDRTPGMFIETDKVRPRAKEVVDVQIVIDGSNYPFQLDEIQFLASSREAMLSLYALVDALSSSKAKSFTVEFPKFGSSERFSLLNAHEALGSAKNFLDDCN